MRGVRRSARGPIGRRVLLAALGFVAIAVSGSAETDGPKALVDGFVSAWNAHDMKAFARLFAEDADFVNVAGMWWKGRADIQAKHEESHATRFKATTLVVKEASERFPRPDVGLVHVRWELTGEVDREGTAAPPRRGILQIVAVRETDGWKIIAAQNTNSAAPPR